jgi:phosphoenolpyruvate---glycerone phosphotransferase subunit DhaL
MTLTGEHVAAAVQRAARRMHEIEATVTQADAALGDGDTGLMLRRLFDRLAATSQAPSPDIGETLHRLAMMGAGATGSTLGTLIVVALLHLAKVTKGRVEIPWPDVGPLLNGTVHAMMERGKASLGDKTVLDPLAAVAKAITGKESEAELKIAAVVAARSTLSAFRGQPCKMGRARMFAEKSLGLDDSGQLAFVEVVSAVCERRCG